MSYLIASFLYPKENNEMRVIIDENDNFEKTHRCMTESRWHKMVTKWEKANQYDNEIQELEQTKTILRHNAYTTKAFDEKFKVIRKPEIINKMCSSDFEIVIDSDDSDDTVILSDHEDDIYCNDDKTLCFIFF